jgi:DNA topoisomerase I
MADERTRRPKKTIKYVQESDEEAEDDSEEEVVLKKPKKDRPATKQPPKKVAAKKIVASDSESDDDNDDNDSDDDNNSDSDDDSDDDDDAEEGDEHTKSAKKRLPPKSSAKKNGKDKPKKKARSEPTAKQLKALTRLERLEEARKAYKWWEAKELPNGLNWRKLEHPGVLFAPPYERHNIPFLYDGEPVELNDEQEEIVTFFAGIPEDGPQLGNPKTREVFKTNFFHDFKATLPPGHVIKKMEKCDFSRIAAHLAMQRSLKKAASEEEKAANKKEKEGLVLKYGYCLIDGRIEKV